MKLIWFTWKDLSHPEAGGAERVSEEIIKRLARDGHEVIMLVAGFRGAEREEVRGDYRIVRLGGRYTVYWHAYRYYRRYLKGWADLIIDEINTVPFFCKHYVCERNILLCYQLCREIWIYQMPFLLGLVGYILEPFYLWLLRDRVVLTESESTRQNLVHFGFNEKSIFIVSVGITLRPLRRFDDVKKFPQVTLLSFGAIREMKRTLDQILAFELAKKYIPELRLIIAGSAQGAYGKKVLRRIAASEYANDIDYLGQVAEVKKAELMQKAHLLLVTSVKEGWGLVVTESNGQGTPAVVYNVDGLRDSVQNGRTGIVTKENNPAALAGEVVGLLQDDARYCEMRRVAWEASQQFTSDKSYSDFMQAITYVR